MSIHHIVSKSKTRQIFKCSNFYLKNNRLNHEDMFHLLRNRNVPSGNKVEMVIVSIKVKVTR